MGTCGGGVLHAGFVITACLAHTGVAPPGEERDRKGKQRMFEIWVGVIAVGGLFCLAGLLVGYLGLLSSVFPEKVRTREISTVVTSDLWKLRICRFRRGRTEGEPVLLVHGLGTNHHNFTEPANACLVDFLVEKGYDCWALDLRGTRSSKAPFERDPMAVSLDDFMLHDIPAAIEHIRRATGYAQVHYVGHSLGGMMLYAYAQEYGSDHIASAVTLGSPIGFDGVKAKAGLALLPIIKRFPFFCADLLKGTFPIVAPLRFNPGVFPMNARNVHPSLRVGDFYTMVDVPVPAVLDEMAHMLHRKVWRMKNDKLDVKAGLSSMDFPLLAIYGKRDPFTPLEQAKRFVDALPHDDKALLICSRENGCKHDYGHCDLAFGVDGARAVFKPIAEWFAAHPIRQRLSLTSEAEAQLMTPIDGEMRAEMLSGERYVNAAGEEVDALESPVEEEPPVAVFPEETSEFLRERQAALQGFAMRVAPTRGTADKQAEEETPKPARRATDAKPKAADKAKATANAKAAPKEKAKPKPPINAAKAKTKAQATPAKATPAKAAPQPAAKPAAKAEVKPAAKPAAAPAKKATAAKAQAKPANKPADKPAMNAVKPSAKAAAKPAPKAAATAKPATTATTKPATTAKPVSKPAPKTGAKTAVKPAPAPAEKPAAKSPAKPAAKAPTKSKALPATLDVLKAASAELAKLDKKK